MMRAVTYPPALHGAARADASGGSILRKDERGEALRRGGGRRSALDFSQIVGVG